MAAPDLVAAELTLTGRITTASNATFLGSIGDVVVVYKPIAGESPLWDFPRGTLGSREVVHEDSPALRRMAVFDVIVNNADRKGDHILAMADGHRHGVDHGLTFHRDHKLRTVLWGWRGNTLTAEEEDGIDRVSEGLHGALGRNLAGLLSAEEIEALAARCTRLLLAGRFPAPSGEMSAVPWPLF